MQDGLRTNKPGSALLQLQVYQHK